MSPSLLGLVEEGESNVTLLVSSASMDSMCQNGSELKERNYMGLSDCSSVGSSTISTLSEDYTHCLNLRATDLRLGLPGSQSPERDAELCLLSSAKLSEKPLFPLLSSKDNNHSLSHKAIVSGNKRGFSDALDGFPEGKIAAHSEVNSMLSPRAAPNLVVKSGTARDNSGTQPAKMKEVASQHARRGLVLPMRIVQIVLVLQKTTVLLLPSKCRYLEKEVFLEKVSLNLGMIFIFDHDRAQVVGWPPIRSFRKNTLATTSKNTDEVEGKAGSGALLVKVSMDGAPYLRKVDLRTYSAYLELSSALEKMFSCFTIVLVC